MYRNESILEVVLLHVDAIIFDATGHFLLHAGEILEGGNRLHTSEVDNDRVGELDTTHGAPIS